MAGLDILALLARMVDLLAIVALVSVSVFGRPSRRIIMIVCVVAIVLPLLRLVLQAAQLADPGQFARILQLVAFDTRYGAVMLARAVLAVLLLLAWRQRPLAIALVLIDIAALSLLGHGAASSWPLFGAIVLGLHIGAACLWLGGMATALFGIVKRQDGAAVLRGFAPLGLACVAVLIVTGLLNVQIASGDILAAFAGGYGVVLIAKLLCFTAMLGLAAVNRFALLRHLDRTGTAAHRAMLALAGETILGAVVIVLAVLLSSGPPA
ncbi:MAG: CopD family protein [Rhodospirillales bacterium]